MNHVVDDDAENGGIGARRRKQQREPEDHAFHGVIVVPAAGRHHEGRLSYVGVAA
jgi:galactose mutarotase-like enzyme